MADIFDYLHWRGDISFKTSQFNPVDNIIFSLIAYLPMDNIVPPVHAGAVPLPVVMKHIIELEKKKPQVRRGYIFGDDESKIVAGLSVAERYRNVMLHSYTNKTDADKRMQFSAVTLNSKECPDYVAFRGTDLTIVGWQEDFNMIFDHAIPAQIEAVNYLQNNVSNIKGSFNIGGHSKGGNLSVYASAFCKGFSKRRILNIYNNDGPGFSKEIIRKNEYKEIQDSIRTFIPEDSIVGLLFEHQQKYSVVHSKGSGFYQHNPFLWQVKRDNMEIVPAVTKNSNFLNKNLMEWLDGMDQETRGQFIDALFGVLNKTNVKSIPDFTDNWFENSTVLLKSMHTLDKKTKDMLVKTFSSLVNVVVNNVSRTIKRKVRRSLAHE
ncbi:hypothetical protein FACS1894102_0760 [Spirochaetia bacterium]|nr:hypothetical protein FACS1894102_0760 [Spirochaetia bacterium]